MTPTRGRTRFLAALTVLVAAPGVWAGRGSWTRIGPEGSPVGVAVVAVAPSNPEVVYADAGTDSGRAGAFRIFRSNDGGASWSIASGGIGVSRVFALSVDPNDPLTVYAAGDFVFKTIDGGSHWSTLSGVPLDAGVHAAALAVDSKISGIVYVATTTADVNGEPGRGVFKSTDGGATWSARNTGLEDYSHIFGLGVSPSSPSVLYLSTSLGFSRSDDGGAHWNPAGSCTLPQGQVAVDPRNPSVVFAGGCRTNDGGGSWTDSNVNLAVFDPANPVVYGTAGGDSKTPPSVYSSVDEGATWQRLATGPPGEGIFAFAVAGSDLLAGFERAGVYRSRDGGRSWGAANAGLSAFEPSSFAVSPVDGSRLWLAAGDRVFRSDDAGFDWTQPSAGDFAAFAIVADPNERDSASVLTDSSQDPSNPYALRGAVMRTTDAGASWVLGAETGFLNRLVADPKTSGILYGTGYQFHLDPGIYKSVDGGGSWNLIENGIGVFLLPGAIAVDPLVPSRLYVADQLSPIAFRSDDAGESWQAAGPIDDHVSELSVGNDPGSTVFVSGSKGVWRSTNHGGHWSLVANLPPALVAVDPRSPGRLYAATTSPIAEFFFSSDAGATWARLPAPDLPDGPVEQVVVSGNGDVYARTPAGIFELDILSISAVPPKTAESVRPRSVREPL